MAVLGFDIDTLKALYERARSARLIRVLGVYLIASWAALQAIDLLTAQFGLPAWFFPIGLGLLLAGLPIVLATAVLQTPPCADVRVISAASWPSCRSVSSALR